MTGNLLIRISLAGVLLGGLITQSAAQTWPPRNFDAFEAACRAQEGMQFVVANAPAEGTPAIDRLCGCLVGKLSGVSQADIDILTKDLLATSTEAERAAHANYADLSRNAGVAVGECAEVVNAGADAPVDTAGVAPSVQEPTPVVPAPAIEPVPLPEPTPQPESPATVAQTPPTPATRPGTGSRMSAEAGSFLNACGASRAFHDYLEERRAGAAASQGGICTCLTAALMPTVAPSDMTLLQRDFAGAAANEDQSSATYPEAATRASDGLRTCMTDAGVPVDF